jgi:hypothetical protein
MVSRAKKRAIAKDQTKNATENYLFGNAVFRKTLRCAQFGIFLCALPMLLSSLPLRKNDPAPHPLLAVLALLLIFYSGTITGRTQTVFPGGALKSFRRLPCDLAAACLAGTIAAFLLITEWPNDGHAGVAFIQAVFVLMGYVLILTAFAGLRSIRRALREE